MPIRNHIVILFALLCGVPVLHAQNLRVEPRLIDLGDVSLKSKRKVEVVCYNEGESPIVLTDIQGGCVCLKATWKKKPVMPGDSTVIQLQFSPNERGAFYKTARIETVPRLEEKQEITVRGKVY